MKFDSYTRFLKSPLYQECILAEVEGRSLPDAQRVPSSPASKHSIGSDHSNVSTPKKVPAPCPALRDGSCPVDRGVPPAATRGPASLAGGPSWPCCLWGYGQLLLWTRARATPLALQACPVRGARTSQPVRSVRLHFMSF